MVEFLFSKCLTLDVSKTGAQDWKAPVAGIEETSGKVICNGLASGKFEKITDTGKADLVFEIQELDAATDAVS